MKPQDEERLRILVVDDDDVDRQAVRRALAATDLAVELAEAPNATTALGAIQARSFDCILLDYMLPDRDGIQLLGELRAQGIQTPVVMLTGQGDEQIAVRLMKAGASDYLAKASLNPAALAQSIRHAVRFYRLELESRRATALHAQQLRALADAAVQLTATRDESDLMARTAARAREVLLADVAEARLAVDVIDQPRRVLCPVLLDLATRIGAGPIRARRDELDAATLDAIARAGLTLPGTSWLAVPILDRDGSPVGLLHACDRSGRQFTEEDASMIVQLGQMASSTLAGIASLRSAERAARARDDVVAVVSHDLRNPLNTFSMGLSMLQRDALTPMAIQTVARMKRAAGRLECILNDLLDIARIDAGTLVLDTAPVRPEDVIDELSDILGPQAAAKGVVLETEVAPSLPAALADRDRLVQILMNVVGNAIKFTLGGGRVVLAARRCGDELCFEVVDSGPGIAAEDLPRVFDRFYQARSTARLGTGLGLSIARGLTEAQGGRLTLDSTVGVGTTVVVALPLERRAAPPPAHEPVLEVSA